MEIRKVRDLYGLKMVTENLYSVVWGSVLESQDGSVIQSGRMYG